MNDERITATSFCELLKENKLLLQYNQDLIKEKLQVQNNWNELKKWIEEDKEVAKTNFEMGRCFNMFDLLNKMQELEQGKDD